MSSSTESSGQTASSSVPPAKIDGLRIIALFKFVKAVVLVEGTGLWLRLRWAEWVTVIATTSLIPFELWELFVRPPGHRWTVFATLLVNVLIAAYLGYLLRSAQRRGQPLPSHEL